MTCRFSQTPGGVRTLGPSLGEHNDDVYQGLLGLAEQEVAGLTASGII
jgi:formyl-CoA transferase